MVKHGKSRVGVLVSCFVLPIGYNQICALIMVSTFLWAYFLTTATPESLLLSIVPGYQAIAMMQLKAPGTRK